MLPTNCKPRRVLIPRDRDIHLRSLVARTPSERASAYRDSIASYEKLLSNDAPDVRINMLHRKVS